MWSYDDGGYGGGWSGALSLAVGLCCSSAPRLALQILDLRSNRIGPTGVTALADLLVAPAPAPAIADDDEAADERGGGGLPPGLWALWLDGNRAGRVEAGRQAMARLTHSTGIQTQYM